MDIYIKGYIQNSLLKLQHTSSQNPEDAPFKVDPKNMGQMFNSQNKRMVHQNFQQT